MSREILQVRVFPGAGFGENAYLLNHGARAVVIDPGAGAPAIRTVIDQEDLALEGIVLTHAHLDHIEGIPDLGLAADLPIWLHPADQPLYDAGPVQAAAFGMRVRPLPTPNQELSHGMSLDVAGVSLEVRHAPGHAPGHVILIDRAHGRVFCGDVVFAGSIGRTDLPGGDHATLLASIRDQVLSLPDEMQLLSGHGPPTTVGQERRTNPFLAVFS